MKRALANFGVGNMKLISSAVCLLLAIGLLAAAFADRKEPVEQIWIPLNAKAEEALNKLDEPIAGQAAGGESGGSGNHTDAAEDVETKATVSTADGEAETARKEQGPEEANSSDDGKLDINRATAAELDELKGIGPSKAKAIVEDRERNGPYSSIEDLLRVSGVGEKLLAGIKDAIVARP